MKVKILAKKRVCEKVYNRILRMNRFKNKTINLWNNLIKKNLNK
jgi:hypothetical protein